MTHAHPSPECRSLLANLSDYLDAELEQALCDRIEAHITQCDDCRLMVDTTRKTIVLYRRVGRVEIPADALGRLWEVLESEGCTQQAPDE